MLEAWSMHRISRQEMKALSIRQPWLHAILHAGKDVENRSWQTNFRGWLALHASRQPERKARYPHGISVPDLATLPYSAICGVARVVGVTSDSDSEWFFRPTDGTSNYGWVLADITPLIAPVPCKGALSLWTVPSSIVIEIHRQLPELRLGD